MRSVINLMLSALVLGFVSCATAPKTTSERTALVQQARSTLNAMRSRDPGLQSVLDGSAGYAVFPSIGKGGLGVGAAYGRGVLFERGVASGFVELNQGSIGAQIGAETFSELVVLRSRDDVARMKGGKFSLGANAQAVALTTGAAANAHFDQGVAVFIVPRGGVMAELSISGQQINYEPMNPPQG
jgi:lipid-binding SYLF domain-containing protein